jgi:broad specificity phosphatase PhoE
VGKDVVCTAYPTSGAGVSLHRMLRPVHGCFFLVLVATCALLARACAHGGVAAFLLVVPPRRPGQAARDVGDPTRERELPEPLPYQHQHGWFRATTKRVHTERDDPTHRAVELWTRRSALTQSGSVAAWWLWALPAGRASAAAAAAEPLLAPAAVAPSFGVDNNHQTPNFNALLDLPPVTEGCVRLYLCRHGQTENNRLRKVQGARIDLPINENGIEQARNVGQALQRLHPPPRTFFSSNLQRAKQTAEIASAEVVEANGRGTIRVIQQLDSLGEVDFGPVAEGRPVALAKAGMQATYAVWATGNIDFRPEGGQGESGREVLQRASLSIAALAKAASESREGTCVAVTHSTFLRILLAMALDVPLLEAATYNVVNGGISVIDVPRNLTTRRLGKTSRLFSGLVPKEVLVDLEIPVCRVVRINETRHLPTTPVVV